MFRQPTVEFNNQFIEKINGFAFDTDSDIEKSLQMLTDLVNETSSLDLNLKSLNYLREKLIAIGEKPNNNPDRTQELLELRFMVYDKLFEALESRLEIFANENDNTMIAQFETCSRIIAYLASWYYADSALFLNYKNEKLFAEDFNIEDQQKSILDRISHYNLDFYEKSKMTSENFEKLDDSQKEKIEKIYQQIFNMNRRVLYNISDEKKQELDDYDLINFSSLSEQLSQLHTAFDDLEYTPEKILSPEERAFTLEELIRLKKAIMNIKSIGDQTLSDDTQLYLMTLITKLAQKISMADVLFPFQNASLEQSVSSLENTLLELDKRAENIITSHSKNKSTVNNKGVRQYELYLREINASIENLKLNYVYSPENDLYLTRLMDLTRKYNTAFEKFTDIILPDLHMHKTAKRNDLLESKKIPKSKSKDYMETKKPLGIFSDKDSKKNLSQNNKARPNSRKK